MKRDNKLKLYYNKEINDLEGMLPLSETEGKWDINLLFYHFITRQYPDDNRSFIEELEKRGYDLTTINFSIAKAEKDYKPIAKRFGIHCRPDFYSCVLNLKGYGYKITNYDKENKTLIFEKNFKGNISKIIFKVSKYGNYSVQTENLNISKMLLYIIEDTLKFLETNKFENLEIDMDFIYETIYGEF